MTNSKQQSALSKEQIDLVITLFSKGELDKALNNANKLIKTFPNNSLLHNIIGATYAGLGQLSSAVDSYERAIELDPNYAKAHFNLGIALHELNLQGFGHLEDPLKSYEKSIEIDPEFAEAHNNLGNILKDLGRFDEAIQSYSNALSIKPDYVETLFSLGVVLFDNGDLEESKKTYEKAIKINPNFAEAYNNLGNTQAELGQKNDAIQSYHKAIEINSSYSEALNNLGNSYKEFGELSKAVKFYKKAIEITPNYPALYNNLGNTYKELGSLDKAVESYSKGLKINPDFIDILNNLGVVLNDLERFKEAIHSFDRAIEINPRYAEAHNNLGVSFNKIGQLEKAILSYKSALRINPDFPDPYNNLTVVFRKQGRINDVISSFKEAIISMNKALTVNPKDADTLNNLGIAYTEIDSLEKAVEVFQKAVAINPEFSDCYYNLGVVQDKLHSYDDAIDSFEKAFAIKSDLKIDYILGSILGAKMNSCNWDNLSNLLKKAEKKINNNEKTVDPFNLMAWIDNPALQRKATEIRVSAEYPRDSNPKSTSLSKKDSKIRIGYFSPDFREHPVGFLTAGLYEAHDRDHFEVHAFSFGPDTNDEMNLRIKAGVDHFHNVEVMSHKEVSELVFSLGIDIAIDLTGLTADCRTHLFAMSAAPIQLSYIGFLGTMAADYYDYLIADPVMIPKASQKYYAEKIVYLPSFQVNDSTDLPPEITLTRKEVGLPEDGFVFCCFNNTYKFTPTIFDSWARILKQVENSVLIVYANNELSKTNLTQEIVQRGVAADRLIFAESIPKSEYLARYRVADLFLDTHPYNAGTTASDALKMGLPMLTMIGQSYQARMGASILTSINLPELITNTPEEYEALAIELATNPNKLNAIKEKLKSNLTTAPLFDTKRFTKNIESAYTQMYERSQKGLEPAHIYVEE